MWRSAYRISGTVVLTLFLAACGGDEGKVESAAIECMENKHRLNEIDKIEIEARSVEHGEAERRRGVERDDGAVLCADREWRDQFQHPDRPRSLCAGLNGARADLFFTRFHTTACLPASSWSR